MVTALRSTYTMSTCAILMSRDNILCLVKNLVGSIPIISGPFHWKSTLRFCSKPKAMGLQRVLGSGALAVGPGPAISLQLLNPNPL